MGIQTMGSQSNGQQQSHLQPSLLTRQNSWYSLTLDEVENQLGELGKPLGSMNVDELLKTVWSADAMEIESESSGSLLQRQASITLARGLSGKTVEEVWREIRQGEKKRFGEEMRGQDGEQMFRELTLEEFLVKAGLFADASVGPAAGFEFPQQQQQQIGLLSSPSIGSLSDTTQGRKRDAPDAYENNLDRRLRRKIKNRESAARSRARKQAYHNELVSKVSQLEEENVILKKEKELEEILPWELSPEPRYQLRRTSSASF